jgi:heme/copper-type cytochrome/quinol oxidase subunit 3
VISVLDARPIAIAHLPGPTFAPFTMAVAFLALFAWALIEETVLLAAGGALAAVAFFLWFRPQLSETLALHELGTRETDPDRLPLAVGGPIASGWWGMLVFIAVLATALITIVASYFYLSDGPVPGASERLGSILEPALATMLTLGAIPAAVWAARGARERVPGTMRVGLVATWLLSAAALGLSLRSFPWGTLDPELSAYASSVLGVLGYQWLVLVVLLVAVTMGLLWALARPLDRRGYAVVYNTSLLAAFTAVSAVVVFAVVFLSPRLW